MTRERIEFWLRQELAGWFVRRLEPLVCGAAWLWRRMLIRTTFIAITGSLGKTTCKECLAAILARRGSTYKTFRNQNGTVLVALNILRVRPWHRFAVLEVAGGEIGIMARSAPIVRPDVAVVLNVKRTHTNAFRSPEERAADKAQLVRALAPGGLAVLSGDSPLVAGMAGGTGARIVHFGLSDGVDYRASGISARWPERLTLNVDAPSGCHRVETQLVGEHWANSVLAALAVAESLGVPLDEAASVMRTVDPFSARMQPVRVPGGAIFLRDDYSASIDGVEASLPVLQQARAERRVLVLTDISDAGVNRRQRLKLLTESIASVADAVVFIGRNADFARKRAIAAGIAPENAHACELIQDAAKLLRTELKPGDLVMLKGRSSDHLARVFLAQLGPVGCWKEYCPKRLLCDMCWELDITPEQLRQAQVVRWEYPESAS